MICPNCDKEIETGIEQCPNCGCHFPVSEKQKREQKRIEKEQKEREEKARQEQQRKERERKERQEKLEKEKHIAEKKERKEESPRKDEGIQNISKQEVSGDLCPNCGKELSSDARFCKWCGTSLLNKEITPEEPSVMLLCPNCGKELKPAARFCNRCGKKMTKD